MMGCVWCTLPFIHIVCIGWTCVPTIYIWHIKPRALGISRKTRVPHLSPAMGFLYCPLTRYWVMNEIGRVLEDAMSDHNSRPRWTRKTRKPLKARGACAIWWWNAMFGGYLTSFGAKWFSVGLLAMLRRGLLWRWGSGTVKVYGVSTKRGSFV